MQDGDDVKLSAKIDIILKTRAKLTTALWDMKFRSLGVLDIEAVTKVFLKVIECFPEKLTHNEVFQQTLIRSIENYLIGKNSSKTIESALINVLSGNIQDMSLGQALTPPASRTTEDFCLACINGVYPISEDCISVFGLHVELISGPAAGYQLDLRLHMPGWKIMSTAGLVNRRNKDDQIHPRYLAGCFLFVKPEEDETGRVMIKEMRGSSSTKSRNKELYLKRTLERDCKYGFDWPCSVCPIGSKECPIATHQETCFVGACPICEREELLDPEYQDVASFECQQAMWY